MEQDTGAEKAVKLINDFQDISFSEIIFVIVGTWLAILTVRKAAPYLAERGPQQMRLLMLGAVPIARLLLMVMAIVWIIPIIFNVTFQNFLVIAGAASVAIGFAFKDYVSSLVAGVVAIVEKPYRPGDWVEIKGDYGEVQSVGLRSLRILTADDNIITVPHAHIWTENISTANDGARTLMCVAHFYLMPDHDATVIRSALQDVALSSAYLDWKKFPLVMLEQTPHGSHYQLKAYPFDLRDQFLFVSDMTERGKQAIFEAGGREVAATHAVQA
ncbi:mechanosensitive ion channel family protein [Sulfitobacter guttiformis]|uniref:Small-conductance mechanosensitive channel n=1 Tax=Sulfitobacter guttiformis TaxID=74349 RepID=A0A420DPK7_9RHOB|nr:mechanosensitive ion channel domain-containing protein [Sulfitobacter guttiformis]KIN73468.1 Small-conductance mechanosensitive channel [Sulfitobacter guttiformis KCTC 32187]RKE96130.1 small-conductance mechanosensitive channel [Sulfitobacter guttiformis]